MTNKNTTELANCVPVARPESQPRCSAGVISASNAVYGSTATLKKIENKKMTTASGNSALTNAPATKNNADNGTPINKNGRRRPNRVHTRSENAPMVG